VVNREVTPLDHRVLYNSPSVETSVGMYKLKEAMEKSCSDLLAIHQRKCTHGRMKIL
jgi:hypothetical protein